MMRTIADAIKSFFNLKLPFWFWATAFICACGYFTQDAWRPLVPDVPEHTVFFQTLEERLVSTTVLISAAKGPGAGSGVLFRHDNKWYCWTAAHVAEGIDQMGGITNANVTARIFRQGVVDYRCHGTVRRVVAVDSKLDLAVLELLVPDFGFTSSQFNGRELQLGQEVLNCANNFGAGIPWTVVRGRISQVPGEGDTEMKRGDYLGVNLTGYPGASGSGIFDKGGRLVGILVTMAGPGLMGFIHNDVMVQFAVTHNIEWAIGRPDLKYEHD